jgi:hypothetical protein
MISKHLPGPVTLAAIEAVAIGGFAGGADPLESVLNGSTKSLVWPAAFALAALGEAGLPALRRGLADGAPEVRVRCARALGLARKFGFAGGPVEPDSPALRAEIYGAIGDDDGPGWSPLEFSLAADLDPEAVSEALFLVRE